MLNEKGLQPKHLRIAPAVFAAHLCRDFARYKPIHDGGYFFKQLAGLTEKSWCQSMDDESRENQESEIGFQNMWSSKILEKERIALEKSDDGVDQVGEQYGEDEEYDDSASGVNDSEHNRKEQDCQKNISCAAIGECHMPPPAIKRRPKIQSVLVSSFSLVDA